MIGTDQQLIGADSSNRSYLRITDPVLPYRKPCIARSYGSGLLSTWAEVFDEDMDYMNAEVFDLLFMDYLCRGGIQRRRYLMVFSEGTPSENKVHKTKTIEAKNTIVLQNSHNISLLLLR